MTVQTYKLCPECDGRGHHYEGFGMNDPEADRVRCEACGGQGGIELVAEDFDGRLVRVCSTGFTGACALLGDGSFIIIDHNNVEVAVEDSQDLELLPCGA